MQSKVAYVDFIEIIDDIETTIKVYETKTHLFVFVNQSTTEIHLYNEFLKKILMKNCNGISNKKVEVICNLKKYSCINKIGENISKIVNGQI